MKTLSLTSLNRITKLDFDRPSHTGAVGGILSATKLKNIQELKAKNNNLTKVRFSTLNNTKLDSVDLSNNELSTAEVDTILETLDTIGLSNGTVKLGGTNALPTLGSYNPALRNLVDNKGWNAEITGGIDTQFDTSHGYTSTNETVQTHPDWEGRPAQIGTPEQWVMDGANNKICLTNARFKNIRTSNPIISRVGSLIRWEVEFDFGSNTLTLDETEREILTIANQGSFSVGDTVTQTNVTNGVTHTIEGRIMEISPSGVKIRIGPPVGQSDITRTPSINADDLDGSPNKTNFKVTNTNNGISNVTIGSESFEVNIVQDNKTLERTAMFSLVDMPVYPASNEGVLTHPNMSIIVKFVANATHGDQVTAFFRKTGFTNGVANSVTIGTMDLSSVEGKRLRIAADINVKETAATTTIGCLFQNLTDNITKSATVNLDKGTTPELDFYNALAGNASTGFKLSLQAGAIEDTNVGSMCVHKATARVIWPNSPSYNINIDWDFTDVPVTSYDPEGNENDRPRVKIFRKDFQYIEYLDAGGIYLDPVTGATSTPPWGDRSTGSSTINIPRANTSGQDQNTVVCLFINDSMDVTFEPDITQWKRIGTQSGESKYQLTLSHKDIGANPDTPGYIHPTSNVFKPRAHDVKITVTPAASSP